jgi:hypothetical protein
MNQKKGTPRERRRDCLASRVEAMILLAFMIEGARPNMKPIKFNLHLV